MTTLILSSTVSNGVTVGGSESAIAFIYSRLLEKYNQDVYAGIGIHQIGDNLDEVIVHHPGNEIWVNIRFPVLKDAASKAEKEIEIYRVNVIHDGLLRIANKEGKLEVDQLDLIKAEVLKNNFQFEFLIRKYRKTRKGITSQVILKPYPSRFQYELILKEGDKEIQRVPFFYGLGTLMYFKNFFKEIEWLSDDLIQLSGDDPDVNTQINIKNGDVQYISMTEYDKHPSLTLCRAGLTESERKKYYKLKYDDHDVTQPKRQVIEKFNQ